jgi:hypothetical protein
MAMGMHAVGMHAVQGSGMLALGAHCGSCVLTLLPCCADVQVDLVKSRYMNQPFDMVRCVSISVQGSGFWFLSAGVEACKLQQ